MKVRHSYVCAVRYRLDPTTRYDKNLTCSWQALLKVVEPLVPFFAQFNDARKRTNIGRWINVCLSAE